MQRLSVLESFILSCLDRGMESGYDLLRNASLSIGATSPALRRLAKAGHISKKVGETTSARPRFQFRLTTKGSKEVQTGWQKYLDADDGLDLESALRVLDMAAHNKAPNKIMADFLRRQTSSRTDQAKRLTLEAALMARRNKLEYPHLKLRLQAAHLEAEAKVLNKLAQSLNRRTESESKSHTQYQQQTLSGLAQKGH